MRCGPLRGESHSYFPSDARNSWFECPEHLKESAPEYKFEFYVRELLRDMAKDRLFKTQADKRFFRNPLLDWVQECLWMFKKWRHKLML